MQRHSITNEDPAIERFPSESSPHEVTAEKTLGKSYERDRRRRTRGHETGEQGAGEQEEG